MPVSSEEKEFVNYVVELMQSMGAVRAKSMFGGHGIFLDKLMFGLIADSVLFLKVDAEIKGDFIAENLKPFTYEKKGKVFEMSYYQAPDAVLEDEDDMSVWANKAYGVALRAAAKKTKK